MSFFEKIVRPVLFRTGGGDAETAHEATLHRLSGLSAKPKALDALRSRYAVAKPVTVFGVDFPNPVGLAAGMDKNGVALPAWPAMGFGFTELGTVTARPQPGNDKPRLFRAVASEAVINRMGFNNDGADAVAERLRALLGTPAGRPGTIDNPSNLIRHRAPGELPPLAGALGLRAPLGISIGKSRG